MNGDRNSASQALGVRGWGGGWCGELFGWSWFGFLLAAEAFGEIAGCLAHSEGCFGCGVDGASRNASFGAPPAWLCHRFPWRLHCYLEEENQTRKCYAVTSTDSDGSEGVNALFKSPITN